MRTYRFGLERIDALETALSQLEPSPGALTEPPLHRGHRRPQSLHLYSGSASLTQKHFGSLKAQALLPDRFHLIVHRVDLLTVVFMKVSHLGPGQCTLAQTVLKLPSTWAWVGLLNGPCGAR